MIEVRLTTDKTEAKPGAVKLKIGRYYSVYDAIIKYCKKNNISLGDIDNKILFDAIVKIERYMSDNEFRTDKIFFWIEQNVEAYLIKQQKPDK